MSWTSEESRRVFYYHERNNNENDDSMSRYTYVTVRYVVLKSHIINLDRLVITWENISIRHFIYEPRPT